MSLVTINQHDKHPLNGAEVTVQVEAHGIRTYPLVLSLTKGEYYDLLVALDDFVFEDEVG